MLDKMCSGGIYLFLGCCLLLFTGCVISDTGLGPAGSRHHKAGGQLAKNGQLSLFLNLVKRDGSHQQMMIQSIEVLAENNSWTLLPLAPLSADSRSILSGQMFLGRSLLSPGYYSKLRVVITMANGSAGSLSQPATVEFPIQNALYVAAGGSYSLFLVWDLSVSFAAGDSLGPRLALEPQEKKLQRDIAYVACPDINTVYMICTDKNWVCDSLGVKGGPGYLFSDPVAPTANLFALTERDTEIKRIGPASNRVEASFRLSTLSKSLHFAVDPISKRAYVIDRRRGNVLRVNLHSGAIEARNRLGYEPSYIIYLKKQGVLAVSLSRSQTVVFLDPQTLTQIQSISTGSKPEGLLLYNDSLLYIAEAGGNSVMVYDLSRNTFKQRIPVGLSPRRLLAIDNRIYVTNYNSRSISILKPGQLGVAKTITLNGPPLELAYSPGNRWLYAGNELAKAIEIIEPASGRIAGRIILGGSPKGIVTLD